jgi:molybdopterin/thiamine biosynthesis adenylyltransferase/rhodanese-related sulfurtransferase
VVADDRKSPGGELDAAERERYSRHLLLPEIGAAGQARLKSARVLVVGAGGLGSPAALYLAAAGVGTLGIIDHDRIELSNLQRQVLFDTANVGQPKADVARARLAALNPGIRVVAHAERLHARNALALIEPYELVVDGSDRLATRYLVNDACVLLRRPLVSAAIHRFEGQATTCLPGRGPCYRCLFPRSDEGAAPNCAEAGVLGVLPGMMGSLQAAEAIKVLLGIGEPLAGRLLTLDALAMRWQEFRFARRADCAACGDRPSITRESLAAGAGAAPEPPTIQPAQLAALLRQGTAAGRASPRILDVREPQEFAAGHLPGSISAPLGGVARHLADMPVESRLVFVCRGGGRSRTACELALGAGIGDVASLEGGLLAWAAIVDPALVVAPAD